MKRCPHCGQEMPVAATDKEILAALVHPSTRTYGRKSNVTEPWLYVAAGPNGRGANWNHWYVTGPDDREGYIRGPFAHDQVLRLAAAKAIVPVDDMDGKPFAYTLARH